MNLNLYTMWQQMGWPVRAVVLVLTAQGIASLAVAIERLWFLASTRASKNVFWNQLRKEAAPTLTATTTLAQKLTGQSVTAGLLLDGVASVTDAAVATEEPTAITLELVDRAIQRNLDDVRDSLHKSLNVLASTGSTAPFVGLLGTVLGIIHAFHQIAATGTGGVGTIGASIGEALIVTGYGLVIAIPTVLVFNALQARLSRRETDIANEVAAVLDRVRAFEVRASTATVTSPSPATASNTNTGSTSTESTPTKVRGAGVRGVTAEA